MSRQKPDFERASDELTLRCVKLRASGLSNAEIGRRIGKTSQFVSTATNRVIRDDMDHIAGTDDANAEAFGAYW